MRIPTSDKLDKMPSNEDTFKSVVRSVDGVDDTVDELGEEWWLWKCVEQCPPSTKKAIEKMLKSGKVWSKTKLAKVAGINPRTLYGNIQRAIRKADKAYDEQKEELRRKYDEV